MALVSASSRNVKNCLPQKKHKEDIASGCSRCRGSDDATVCMYTAIRMSYVCPLAISTVSLLLVAGNLLGVLDIRNALHNSPP